MTLADLRALLSNKNVAAFLRVIRQGESNQDDSAYTLLNGGGYFIGLLNHPYAGQKTPPAKAAGAYQFIASTWGEVSRLYGIPGFGPREQDIGAVGRIIYRQALDDVVAGRFAVAVAKCKQEWTSLPGAAESHAAWTLAKAQALYQSYGGALGVVHKDAPSTNVGQRKSMPILALLSAFGPMLAQMIPAVAKLLNPNPSEVATRNLDAAQLVLDTVVKASGQPNVQGAVEAMQADPALTKSVAEAVVTEPSIMAVLEIGGGIKAARETDAVSTQAVKGFWHSPAFWISLVLLAMPFMLLADVFYVHPTDYDGNLKTQIVTGVLAVIMVVCGFWLGSSQGSQKKDDALIQKGVGNV